MTKPKSRPALRLFVDQPMKLGQTLELSEAHAHYLLKVMRRHDGDQVGVFNARDGELAGTLVTTGKRSANLELTAQVLEPLPADQLGRDIHLVCAPLKRGPTEMLVQKASELGVASVQFVTTAHSNPERLKLERLEAIAIEAVEQSEQLRPPKILEPVALETLLAGWPQAHLLLVLAEAGDNPPLHQIAAELPADLTLSVLVGPEGGFNSREFEVLAKHPQARLCALGPRILKAETAAIVGLALVQALAGDGEQTPNFRGAA